MMPRMIVRWRSRFFNFGLIRGIELLQVFGGIFVELLEAAFAAELDLAVAVGENVSRAHVAQFLARDHAGVERIRFNGGWLGFSVGQGDEGEGRGGKGEGGDVFHSLHFL